MKSLRKPILIPAIIIALIVLCAGTHGCVKAKTDNLLDPSNAGWPAWFLLGQGTCRFNQHTFSDQCIMR